MWCANLFHSVARDLCRTVLWKCSSGCSVSLRAIKRVPRALEPWLPRQWPTKECVQRARGTQEFSSRWPRVAGACPKDSYACVNIIMGIIAPPCRHEVTQVWLLATPHRGAAASTRAGGSNGSKVLNLTLVGAIPQLQPTPKLLISINTSGKQVVVVACGGSSHCVGASWWPWRKWKKRVFFYRKGCGISSLVNASVHAMIELSYSRHRNGK